IREKEDEAASEKAVALAPSGTDESVPGATKNGVKQLILVAGLLCAAAPATAQVADSAAAA
ncbi:MAG: hypothetical protein GWM90_09265, partial [Gemmatimonadetes bacterium]|nr:hypothetical protein [Gemmatimonadota bacterium]NIQ54086.1 hypothetical protein [Gemmatimonadota bacterium]NIU74280.1 hypothetical protein [Gammaproteobacteria bacterium]NIX44296.1 hypothetical protein [Gemmatimonadota bacterium]NIY08513.1 hypothetical protein [Gemmatimonadota bacterium]